MVSAPRNGVRGAPTQRWLEQEWTKKSWDATSLVDPKVISQHFRGIKESYNVSGHVYRREQHRYLSHTLDTAPWPDKLFRRAAERAGWIGGPWERVCWNPAALAQERSLLSWVRIQMPPVVLLTKWGITSGWRVTSLTSLDVLVSKE